MRLGARFAERSRRFSSQTMVTIGAAPAAAGPLRFLSLRAARCLIRRARLPLSTAGGAGAGCASYCYCSDPSSAVEELQRQLPHCEFSTNPYELTRHGRGESYHPSRPPDAIVYPRTVTDVRRIVQHCVRCRLPLIPFGAGTSVEGHVCALHGGLSVDMARFQSIEGPNGATGDDGAALPDPLAIVGAGVTRSRLNQELRHTGLQFVVDPGADATIGGMVATGASGTTAVRYGTMRENILAVECVVPGQDEAVVVRAGTRALKNSAGYDLVSLMCGSEGTLGVITSITVKLHAIPEHVVAALCVFESLSDAAQAVVTLKLNELPVSRCELLDASSVEVYNTYADKEESSLEVNPTLFLEFQGPSENSLQECVSMTESICKEEFGGSAFEFASSEEDRRALWSARHNLYPACVAFRPGCGGAIVTDACVPLSKFAKLIEETARDVREQGVVGPCFGHAADGNLHCILPVREDDSEEYKRKLQLVHENLIRRTMAAGGSCTGEHGVGYGKLPYLPQQYGPGAPHMMKAIKMAIDPHNIMNPGKVVPC